MKSFLHFRCCIGTGIFSFFQSNIQQPTSINSDGEAPAASAHLEKISAAVQGAGILLEK